MCHSEEQFGPPQLGLHTVPLFTIISSKVLQGTDRRSFSDVGSKHTSNLCCCASEHTRGSLVPGRHQYPALDVSCDLHASIADSAAVFDVTDVCAPIITAIKDIAANTANCLMVPVLLYLVDLLRLVWQQVGVATSRVYNSINHSFTNGSVTTLKTRNKSGRNTKSVE